MAGRGLAGRAVGPVLDSDLLGVGEAGALQQGLVDLLVEGEPLPKLSRSSVRLNIPLQRKRFLGHRETGTKEPGRLNEKCA